MLSSYYSGFFFLSLSLFRLLKVLFFSNLIAVRRRVAYIAVSNVQLINIVWSESQKGEKIISEKYGASEMAQQ